MYVVALTGGIGSGKSAATAIFAELGVPIVDVDVISHQLTAPGMPLLANIRAAFGAAVFNEKNELDRAKLRELVFNQPAAREQLNAILHPAIYAEAVQQLHMQQNAPYQILAIPLLDHQSPYLAHIQRVLVIDCDEELQIARTQQRSGLSRAQVLAIIQAQSTRQQRLALADDVVENNENLTKLRENIVKLHEKYINTCIVSKTIS